MAAGLPLDSAGFRDALVILGAAGIVIPAFHRINVTPVIGFILFGVLFGPSGLGALTDRVPALGAVTISNREALAPFAEFGIILLLFSIGLELSFKRLWSMRRLVFMVGAAELVVAALLIAAALMLLGRAPGTALALGLALSLSSTAVVLQLVGTRGAVGRPAFAMLLFEDLALVPIVFLLGALGPAGGTDGTDLAWMLGMGAAAVAAILVGGRRVLPLLFAQAARTRSPELLLSAVLVVVILCSLLTSAVGLSPIVGALVAGLVIAETAYRAQVEVTIEPFKNLALGVFLITVGMSLDLGTLIARWPEVVGGVVLVVAIKASVTAGLLRWSGLALGTAVNTGVLMAAPSETTLIVLGAGASAGVITAAQNELWQMVTALGLTLTPLLARLGHRAGKRAEQLAPPPPPAPPTEEEAAKRVVVLGFGRVGRVVASLLEKHGVPYVAVDGDPDLVRGEAEGAKRPVVYGDGGKLEFLKLLEAGKARALVVTLDAHQVSEHVIKAARSEWPELTIIARARDARHAATLYRAGASDVVPETIESSLQLSEAVLSDIGVPMGRVIASIHERRSEMRSEIRAAVPGMDSDPAMGRRRARDGVKAR